MLDKNILKYKIGFFINQTWINWKQIKNIQATFFYKLWNSNVDKIQQKQKNVHIIIL